MATLLIALMLAWLSSPRVAESADAGSLHSPVPGQRVILDAPHREQFDIAFDEVVLDWSRVPRAKDRVPAAAIVTLPGTTVLETTATHALVGVSGVASRADLLRVARSLVAANSGAEVHLVLYPAHGARTPGTRRWLTREVELLLTENTDPWSVLGGDPVDSVTRIRGVRDAYVVRVADPFEALDLADALRRDPRVRSAEPSVRRQQVPR